ncbi:MAG: outer membrane protein assembly factor BamE [Holosporales bacterium]|nr:outer membrane protein assembly factor BamE [Holosporales bacterium]
MRYLPLLFMAVLYLTACTSRHDIRGNLLGHDDIARLKPHQQTQEDVLEILGPPSLKQDATHWIYVGQEQETEAFFAPQVKKQRTFLVTFDDTGRYLRIEEHLLKGRTILLDPDTSIENGQEMTVLGQTLDNLRRTSRRGKRDKE